MNMETKDVPYIAFEGEMTRLERMNHKLFVLCLALLIALVGSNVAWIAYESQFETYTETTVTQKSETNGDGDAVNKFTGGDEYGESGTDGNN